jgi:hypothetical protein
VQSDDGEVRVEARADEDGLVQDQHSFFQSSKVAVSS